METLQNRQNIKTIL